VPLDQKIRRKFADAELFLANLAGLISLALILAYALITEYHHLFG